MAMKRVGHLCLLQIKELLRNPTFYAYLCLFFVYYHYLADGAVRLQRKAVYGSMHGDTPRASFQTISRRWPLVWAR